MTDIRDLTSVRAWTRPLAFRVERHDAHRWFTLAALGGLVLGGLMAVFGLPPVDVHGLAHYFGIMDPMCGGTRSVWAAMSGDWKMSFTYNPIGIPLVVGAVATLIRAAIGAATGYWLNTYVRSWPVVAAVSAVLFVALAINQQLHADLLRTPGEEFSPVGPILNALPLLIVWTVVTVRGRMMRRRG
ncbi:DUF2752 domain-containing protein [Nocardiopsis gilva YIM 90087]|uniref:DUF2752 domain-containing protein n=1 Tax=Nocardiopsis gilva YIM 90087 TaxID=1235441 RepID=A0A223S0U5_9ACTN|nr:DUF2752 domain-containing protein [Nocardiopsis gilva]ASU81639.1 DUF2752 domain-containing protein [Nocardiopsis gilva YIM 90087]